MPKKYLLIIAVSIVGVLLILAGYLVTQQTIAAPIKVGVLHSLSGTMAISEQSVANATLLAIEELNQKGGVLGRKIEPILVDGKSDPATFAGEAERLITQEKVSTVFGGWTSASRKTMRPIFEKYNHLLFYPVQYEGLETSPNIVYTGAAPNQQIIPAVKWCLDNVGKRFFLVGSDYVFPRTANTIIKDQLGLLQGTVVGEEYIKLGSTDVKSLIQKIVRSKPDIILNTINGDSNVAFLKELRGAGISHDQLPVMSFSLAEPELRSLNLPELVGDYTAWNYFQSIDSPTNSAFIKKYQAKYGANQVTSDPMEAAYFGVLLWAQAVETAGSAQTEDIRGAIREQSLQAPEGIVYIDRDTQHTWKSVRIGKIKPDGQFEIIWSSERPVRPLPYPPFRSRNEWDDFLKQLYNGWQQNWSNPG